jgi:hypothetical protein
MYSKCLLGSLVTMTVESFLSLVFAIFRIVTWVAWLVLALVVLTHNVFGILTDFIFLLLYLLVLSALTSRLHLCYHFFSGIIV